MTKVKHLVRVDLKTGHFQVSHISAVTLGAVVDLG